MKYKLTNAQNKLTEVMNTLKECVMEGGGDFDMDSFAILMDIWEENYNIDLFLKRWDTDGKRLSRELINEAMMDDDNE